MQSYKQNLWDWRRRWQRYKLEQKLLKLRKFGQESSCRNIKQNRSKSAEWWQYVPARSAGQKTKSSSSRRRTWAGFKLTYHILQFSISLSNSNHFTSAKRCRRESCIIDFTSAKMEFASAIFKKLYSSKYSIKRCCKQITSIPKFVWPYK